MGRAESATIPLPVLEEEGEDIRYLTDKLCRLCELTKPIPEQDDVCEDCWALRMAGRAVVTCPFYLFEVQDPNVPDGRVPIELCYSCSFRSGWTEDLGPICNHPIAVDIVKRWEVELVHCPKESTLAQESRFVPLETTCKACRWHRGELVMEAGRYVYCGIPYEMTVRPAEKARGNRPETPSRDKTEKEPLAACRSRKGA